MKQYPWFRLYSEIRTDPKMDMLTDEQFRVWIHLLCLASEATERGMVQLAQGKPYPDDVLARALKTSGVTWRDTRVTFAELGLVDARDEGIEVLHFIDRQYDKPSDMPDSTRKRQRKSRAGHADVTQKSRPIIEKNIVDNIPPNPQGGPEEKSQKPRKKRQPPVEPDGYPELYEQYPRHEKRAEGAALYGEYSAEEREQIGVAVANYQAYNRYYEKEQDKILLISTFLSWDKRPWVDWLREENAKWAKLPETARFQREQRLTAPPPIRALTPDQKDAQRLSDGTYIEGLSPREREAREREIAERRMVTA